MYLALVVGQKFHSLLFSNFPLICYSNCWGFFFNCFLGGWTFYSGAVKCVEIGKNTNIIIPSPFVYYLQLRVASLSSFCLLS
jgi:hypothetical protein